MFQAGFSRLEEQLSKRFFISVQIFIEDFGNIINAAPRSSSIENSAEADTHQQNGDLTKDAPPDPKYRKALVTRIAKAVKPYFEDALRKESELCQRPFEQELANLEKILENGVQSRRDSLTESQHGGREDGSMQLRRSNRSHAPDEFQLNSTAEDDTMQSTHKVAAIKTQASSEERSVKRQGPTPDSSTSANGVHNKRRKATSASSQSDKVNAVTEPPTPPMSLEGESQSLSHGGIAWYMEPFDPVGTTIHEERWTGRELVRGMSEDLSDMDEEELSGLHPGESEATPNSKNSLSEEQAAIAKARARKRRNARRRRWR